ncbi:MAG: hypothetical protein RR397_10765 [Odoribacter sp.]
MNTTTLFSIIRNSFENASINEVIENNEYTEIIFSDAWGNLWEMLLENGIYKFYQL